MFSLVEVAYMNEILGIADNIMNAALNNNVEQVEIVINNAHIGVARFKDRAIHQNIEGFRPIGPPHNNFSVKLRVIKDKKLGMATASTINKSSLIKDALKSAKYGRTFETFISPKRAPSLSNLYHRDTANLEPEVRIEAVNRIVDYSKDLSENIESVGGVLSNMSSKTVLINSLGLEAKHEFTGSQVIVTAVAEKTGNQGSGYQRQDSRNFYDLDLENVAEEAATSAISTIGYRKQTIPTGKRTVIFESEAAAEFLGTLIQQAFSIERDPRTTSKVPLGELVLDDMLTVHDNGRNLRTLQAAAIDGEGTPKMDLCLINNGVPENRCYSRDSAKSNGTFSTGHATSPWTGYFWTGTGNGSTYTPTNQIIEPGNSSLDELISDTKEGILVRRLRCPAAKGQTIMPDIIRADTQECWRVKNGEVAGPANYIRFTDSLVDTLKDIEIGDSTTVKSIGSFVIPALKIHSLYISQPSIIMVQ
ncbi:hypothetical protein CL673_02035 [Candidatus Bathyarchaeota archaeon]|jgi:predicted Zn-dependent protease|nr:hypothetical protein [Candidatus Bathyarchaeota archaeon]